MTQRRHDVNKLLVEGKQDLFCIAYLLDHSIVWGNRPDECVDGSLEYEEIDELLGPDEIETVLQTPGLEAVGIVVDANGNAQARWEQVRSHCLRDFPSLPLPLPPQGVHEVNGAGLRLGVWILPDNQAAGMLETLLAKLIPTNQSPILDYARESVAEARTRGAPVQSAHVPKAEIHTWLSWQDPPDLQLHQAIVARVLDPASPLAVPFVEWFIRLFQLDDLRRPVATP